MIVTENVTRYGREFVRTYSDGGYRIMQDGTGRIYDEAIDPADKGRTYTETEELIEDGTATVADYLEALERFGVSE